MPTYYEILGVDPNASQEEIQAAYDAILKQCYANLRNPKTHNESVERIKQIKQARDNLLDPDLHKKYETALAEEEIRKSEPPNPQRRFAARFFDQLVFFVLFYPVYRYCADYVFFEDWALALEATGIGILLYFLLETAVLFIFRSTPGKWMLSIRLTDSDGQKPKRLRLAKRNVLSALFGLALDIPPFSIVAMALQYRAIYKPENNGLSVWDRACGTAVRYAPIQKVRMLLILPVIVLAIIALVSII
jgi:uncharacterized RDD family membrane protein YckC